MKSMNPPLSPWLKNGQSLLLPEHFKPWKSACDGDIGVNIPRIDPNPESLFDESGIDPDASIREADIGICHIVRALLKMNVINVQKLVHFRNIEEVMDSDSILAVHITF